jgi:branched-chain amino acid transport system substrate-binding protein
MADVATERLSLKSVSILFINNDFGAGLRGVFADEFERRAGRILSAQGYNADQTDYRPYLARIASESPDGIYVAGYFKDTAAIMRQARELGIKSQFLGSTTDEDPQLIQIAGESAEGLVYPYSTGYDAKSLDPAVLGFNAAFRKSYHRDPGLVAALGYDCANLLVAAVQAGDPSGDSIRAHLASTKNFEGATGAITFDARGDVIKPILLKTVRNGKFVAWDSH